MKGTLVRLTTASGQTRDGCILLCSSNEDSLMVKLDDGLPTRSGLYADMVPLLRVDGEYHELMGGEPVQVEVLR